MVAAVKVERNEESFPEFCRRHLALNRNWDAAVSAAVSELMNDEKTLQRLTQPILEFAVRDMMRQCDRKKRTVMVSGQDRCKSDGGLCGLALVNVETLLDFPCPGGVRLGDCARDDVERFAGIYESNARSNAHRARWMRLIAAKLGASDIVQDVLGHDDLEALHSAASEGRA